MNSQRRGIVLIEMLTVLLILGIGGSLMAVALDSILRSQRRVADLGNRYAVVTDFIQCFSRDVRSSTSAVLQEGDNDELRQVLLLGDPTCRVSYRFFGQRVERVGCTGSTDATQSWTHLDVLVDKTLGHPGTGDSAVGVTIRWHRMDAEDPEPNRRFDLMVRCAGELDDEEN